MQYENISPELLEGKWSKVTLVVQWQLRETNVQAELNCYESRGRYNYRVDESIISNGNEDLMHIWFELEEDATYFALKFAS